MSDKAFIDTNVLVYVHDHRNSFKQRRAIDVMDDRDLLPVISCQVLSEFYVTVTRKLVPAAAPAVAAELVRTLTELPVIQIDAPLVRAAIATSQQSQLSYWDALIIEAAVAGGCDRLLTEDLAAGSVIRGVRIENPFTPDTP